MMNRALVTGATSGIGLAIVEELLKDDCYVYINYAHDSSKANDVRKRLANYRESFDFIRADLCEYKGIDNIETALKDSGAKLSYLVINFGMTDRTAFDEVTIEDWEKVMRANVSVPFFLIQRLFSSGLFTNDASVLCMSSLMASIPHSVSVSYGVSKSALSTLSRNLVKYLAPSGIRINAIEPGFVDTPWQKEKSFDRRARIEAKTALNRFAEPKEVAEICIAALKNTYLTGSIIPISGGYGMV